MAAFGAMKIGRGFNPRRAFGKAPPIGLDFRIEYFRPNLVLSGVSKVEYKRLWDSGKEMRKRARKLMRFRKDGSVHSPPGSPPFSHVSGRAYSLKNAIRYGIDTTTRSAVAGFHKRAKHVGALHEHGGTGPVTEVKWKTRNGKHVLVKEKKQKPFPARPTMQPTLSQLSAEGKLEKLWRGAVK